MPENLVAVKQSTKNSEMSINFCGELGGVTSLSPRAFRIGSMGLGRAKKVFASRCQRTRVLKVSPGQGQAKLSGTAFEEAWKRAQSFQLRAGFFNENR